MAKKNIPFDFIFDYLISLNIVVKPMFGLYAIYVENKIVLILRQRDKNPESNGIWIATTKEHYKRLKIELSTKPIFDSDENEDYEWQLIPEDAQDFEISARKVCDLIVNRDHRIGRIPLKKKRKM